MTPVDAARRMPNLDVVTVARYYRAVDDNDPRPDYWRALALRLGHAADRAPRGAAEALALYALDACRRVHEIVHPSPEMAGSSVTPALADHARPGPILLIVTLEPDDSEPATAAPAPPARNPDTLN